MLVMLQMLYAVERGYKEAVGHLVTLPMGEELQGGKCGVRQGYHSVYCVSAGKDLYHLEVLLQWINLNFSALI